MLSSADFLIIGGGIVGLSLAKKLRLSFGTSPSLVVLEKEASIGLHFSGRNSGVKH